MFKIAYSSLRVFGGEYRRIDYDSVTNSIALTKISASSTLASEVKAKSISKPSQYQSQTQSSKKISIPQRERLIQTIIGSEIFQTDAFYPPDPLGDQDYTLFVFAVNLEGKKQSTIWTDISGNAPGGLESVVKAIEEIASG